MDLHEAYSELKDTLQRMGIDISVVENNPPITTIIDIDQIPQSEKDFESLIEGFDVFRD
jgi:hypothetical protein